jgi:hypothetical protein
LVADPDRALIRPVNSKKESGGFGSSRTKETGQANYFSRPDVQVERLEKALST